ncbi:MAG: glutaredoxin family protein [Pseudomonadota bacterium]
MQQLILYTRQGCHLCEDLLESALPLLRGKAEIQMIDIDQQDALRPQFDKRIPVLLDADRVIMEGQFDRKALIQWLVSRQV